ncbi:hypothetical protein SAMN04489867_1569 [Pedococcus dokdonensis]|uniref:Uncharacterized protein n=1 Tax=Pedococcus dokdonensis TaxID=443156 RepID=A0A1H0QDS9_9MICO|nr:hypothetical protein [Pedococcus dokdonensis]SDP15512.1 hypothetical protein SAMN04489867_1569 [Pedococcus dokdonensis]
MIRRLTGLPPAQQFVVVLGVAVAVGALAVSVSALGDAGMLLASAALLAALANLAQWLWQSRQSTDWDNTFSESAPPRGVDSRISRLAGDVREAGSGTAASATRVHATLSSLAADRLRQHPDPAAEASTVLGRDLAAYLAAPPSTRITAAQLAAFTTTLEELS